MELNKQKAQLKSSASDAIIDQGLRSYMLKFTTIWLQVFSYWSCSFIII